MAIPEETQQEELAQKPTGEENGTAREEPGSDPDPEPWEENEEGPITGDQPPEPDGEEGEGGSGEQSEEAQQADGEEGVNAPGAEAQQGEEPVPADGQEPEPQGAEKPRDIKLAVQITAGRTIVGVQRAGTDPHMETIQEDDLVAVLWEIPSIVERAQESWEESPMRPRYQKPRAASGRKNQGKGRNSRTQEDRTKPADPPQGAEGEPQQGELPQPEEAQPSMARLF